MPCYKSTDPFFNELAGHNTGAVFQIFRASCAAGEGSAPTISFYDDGRMMPVAGVFVMAMRMAASGAESSKRT
jgi:hypothetical protein